MRLLADHDPTIPAMPAVPAGKKPRAVSAHVPKTSATPTRGPVRVHSGASRSVHGAGGHDDPVVLLSSDVEVISDDDDIVELASNIADIRARNPAVRLKTKPEPEISGPSTPFHSTKHIKNLRADARDRSLGKPSKTQVGKQVVTFILHVHLQSLDGKITGTRVPLQTTAGRMDDVRAGNSFLLYDVIDPQYIVPRGYAPKSCERTQSAQQLVA